MSEGSDEGFGVDEGSEDGDDVSSDGLSALAGGSDSSGGGGGSDRSGGGGGRNRSGGGGDTGTG